MEGLVCPFCSGVVEAVGQERFGKCKYCRRTFSMRNAADMGKASDDDRKNVVKWRKEMMDNLDSVERSQKKRDYSVVKHFALQILTVLSGDFASRYFVALSDYKSGNDSPYIDFLENCDTSNASGEEIELISGKIIDYAEKKHEEKIKGYFVRIYGAGASTYVERAQKAIADYIAHMRLTGIRDCDVFICHSSVDAAEAQRLTVALERDGLTCWLAERNLLPGTQNYEEELRGAVEHCRMLLFVSSANAIYSKECEKELRMANAEGKLFFTVKIDNEPHYGISKNILSRVQWINAFDGVEAHGDEIAAAVKMVFADDEKERAELERRALEARKRAAAAQKPTTQAAFRDVSNADMYITQLEAWAKNAESALEDIDKGNELVDKGLADNPQNSDLWLWKFILTVAVKVYDDADSFAHADDIADRMVTVVKNTDAEVRNSYETFLDSIECTDPDILTAAQIKTVINEYNNKSSALSTATSFVRRKLSPHGDLKSFVIGDVIGLSPSMLSDIYFDKAYDCGNDDTKREFDDIRTRAKAKFEENMVELAERCVIDAINKFICNRVSELNTKAQDVQKRKNTHLDKVSRLTNELKKKKLLIIFIVFPCILVIAFCIAPAFIWGIAFLGSISMIPVPIAILIVVGKKTEWYYYKSKKKYIIENNIDVEKCEEEYKVLNAKRDEINAYYGTVGKNNGSSYQ